MSGNKCRPPIYSRQRPAAIRPHARSPARLPPRGLVCLRLLSCPHISRVHWKRVNIPASSVCSGLTQQKARRRSKRAESRVFLAGAGSLWQTDPRLSADWRPPAPPSGSQTQISLPVPQAASRLPFLPLSLSLCLVLAFNPRIRPFSREQSRREEGARALGSPESHQGSALAV